MIEFQSILYPFGKQLSGSETVSASFLSDVELDRVFETLSRYCDDPAPLYEPVNDLATLHYRQQIFQDLESLPLRRRFIRFSKQMKSLQKYATSVQTNTSDLTECSRCLAAADQYTQSLHEFLDQFPYSAVHSEGLSAFMRYCSQCHTAPQIVRMRLDIIRLKRELSQIEYSLLFKGDSIFVAYSQQRSEISQRLSAVFSCLGESYQSGATCLAPKGESDSRVENGILTRVAELFPDVFSQLRAFAKSNSSFIDQRLLRFSDELQIYCSYLDYTDRLKAVGLPFCYPEIGETPDTYECLDSFDLALADSLRDVSEVPVLNGFSLTQQERIIVVTGPNQGGKTTFARMFGQLHYLASLGFFVPGRSAHLKQVSHFYSHFSSTVNIVSGGLKSELLRLKTITDQADESSVVIINEIFAAATMSDGLALGQKMIECLTEIGCLAVCVTFLEDLAIQNPSTVSMISIVPPDDPSARTYTILRKPPQGKAYAEFLAEANQLRYEQIRRRMRK